MSTEREKWGQWFNVPESRYKGIHGTQYDGVDVDLSVCACCGYADDHSETCVIRAIEAIEDERDHLKAELASKQCPICGGHPKCCSACCWQQADIDYIKAQLVEARVLLITQGAEKQKLQKLLVEAKGLVQGSATVFADYARLHEAKDTPEGYHKAKANMRQAEHLREFLSKPEIKELQ